MKRLVVRVGLLLVWTGFAVAAQHLASSMASADEWRGRWIQAPWSTERDGAELDGSRPMPIFRREFMVRGTVASATLRIAGLGQYEARSGSEGRMHLAAPQGLHQAWTDYRKTVTFETYDVTKMVTPGPHV